MHSPIQPLVPRGDPKVYGNQIGEPLYSYDLFKCIVVKSQNLRRIWPCMFLNVVVKWVGIISIFKIIGLT